MLFPFIVVEGSSFGMQLSCGDRSVYCPTGSGAPTPVTSGYYSVGYENQTTTQAVSVSGNSPYLPTYWTTQMTSQQQCSPGSYCHGGISFLCPQGKYGATAGLTDAMCSGSCMEGYYCPTGSTSATQVPCGSSSVFCPTGTGEPLPVYPGYYSVGGNDDTTRTAERKCEPGSYCVGGVRHLCAAGRWGGGFGALNSSCSGPCAAGYYCPAGSSDPMEVMCGDPSRYCLPGASHPSIVPLGNYSIGGTESTRTGSLVAPMGFYAVDGMLYRCRAGYFGNIAGLSSPDCSGPCTVPGFYCPAGSTSPVMRACGGDNLYCPAGTLAPLQVDTGCFTADYLYNSCPPGTWRNVSGLGPDLTVKDYSAIPSFSWPPCQTCPPGTYKPTSGDALGLCKPCPAYSVSAPDGVLCQCITIIDYSLADDDGRQSSISAIYNSSNILTFPHLEAALGLPLSAQGQATSATDTMVFNATTGHCIKLPRYIAVFLNDGYLMHNVSLTRSQEIPCQPGRYCQGGQRFLCPPGTYSASYRQTNPLCEGACNAGYYCPYGATSSFGLPCNNSALICPQGSGTPLAVPPGFYSNEDARETLRSSMAPCEPGMYCPGDGRRYPCPAGTYADVSGTYSQSCVGLCAPGYYCPPGSSSAQQVPCGDSSVYCPTGSALPSPTHAGFYSVHTGPDALTRRIIDSVNATMSAEIPCDPGYYCTGGIKYPCPPGSYNWRFGLPSATCPLCAPGYYCPSYLTPQPTSIAPSYTQWPQAPQTVANPFPCGSLAYYCPTGSSYPLLTPAGSYTDGGNGTTGSVSTTCPPGSYCANGLKTPCPRGRYGATSGLSTRVCTAPCPAGFYCPVGTAVPIACPQDQYAVEGSWKCMNCPGGGGARAKPMPCHTDKGCCFRVKI